MTGCLCPNDCSCTICRRQPPSLLASASNTLFQLVHELDRIALTNETTYGQYVIAVRSRRLPPRRLLPPDFPSVRLCFRSDAFSHKLHHHCLGKGTWEVDMKQTFESEIEAIISLVKLETLFGCRHCKKVSSFLPSAVYYTPYFRAAGRCVCAI